MKGYIMINDNIAILNFVVQKMTSQLYTEAKR